MPCTLTAGGAPGAKSAFNCGTTALGHRGPRMRTMKLPGGIDSGICALHWRRVSSRSQAGSAVLYHCLEPVRRQIALYRRVCWLPVCR
jgi:hypothetical protein